MVSLDLAGGAVDDDGVVEVVDQVAPLVEVSVLDREIMEGVKDHTSGSFVEVEGDSPFSNDLDSMQGTIASSLNFEVGHEPVELAALLDADDEVPTTSPRLLCLDIRSNSRQAGSFEPLADKGGQISPRDLLSNRNELIRCHLAPTVALVYRRHDIEEGCVTQQQP